MSPEFSYSQVDVQLVAQHPIDAHSEHRPHGEGGGGDFDPALFDRRDDGRDRLLGLDKRISGPNLPDVVTVGRADQRSAIVLGGLDRLLIRVDEVVVEGRKLDGVKRIDVRFQVRPEAPEPGIERMRRDDEVPVAPDAGQVIERPEIIGLPEVRVDDDDVLVGKRQFDAGKKKKAPTLGVFLEVSVECDDIVVGYGQGI